MNEFYWIAVAAVVVLSAARLTRLLTYDAFPPVAWARDKYADRTDGTNWQILAFCPYCMSFWVTAFVILWADLSGIFDGEPVFGAGFLVPLWWFVNGTLGASYLAAMVQIHDGDDE